AVFHDGSETREVSFHLAAGRTFDSRNAFHDKVYNVATTWEDMMIDRLGNPCIPSWSCEIGSNVLAKLPVAENFFFELYYRSIHHIEAVTASQSSRERPRDMVAADGSPMLHDERGGTNTGIGGPQHRDS